MAASPRAGNNKATNVSEAVLSRRSCRAFTTQRVDLDLVRGLLDVARQAPSGGNLQPWCVNVLTDDSLARFRAMMRPKIEAAPLGGATEYSIYPPNVKEPYRCRRFKVGEDMYGHIGIRREDKAGRIRQFARNFDFFWRTGGHVLPHRPDYGTSAMVGSRDVHSDPHAARSREGP